MAGPRPVFNQIDTVRSNVDASLAVGLTSPISEQHGAAPPEV